MIDNQYKKGLNEIQRLIHNRIKKELILQGHIMTGKVYKDHSEEISIKSDEVHLMGRYPFYSKFLHTGIHSSKIPYDPAIRTGAKHSSYIDALIAYAEFRGMTDPKNAAFAIANVHSREGMSTKASAKHSKTGIRSDFLDIVFFDRQLNENIINNLDKVFLILFDNMITRQQKIINQTA